MNINTRDLSFLNFNGTEMQWLKYNNLLVWEAWEELKASGLFPLTLNKCKGVNLVDYKIYGESIQDGTPTPDTPIEVESVGEKTNNLFDNNFSKYAKPVNYWLLPIELKEDTSYTIKAELVGKQMTGIAVGITPTGTQYSEFTGWRSCLSAAGQHSTQHFRTNDTWDSPKLAVFASNEEQFNEIFKNYNIQLIEGTTDVDYEPYGYKIPVKASGLNLCKSSRKNTTTVYNGVTQTIDENGVITLNGTSTNTSFPSYADTKTFFLPKGTYTLLGNMTGRGIAEDGTEREFRFFLQEDESGSSKTLASSSTEAVSFTTDRDWYCKMYVYISAVGYTFDNVKYYPMLVKGEYTAETMPQFEPYVEPVTTNIYLDEPLRKIGDYADHIDFKTKQVVRNIKETVFDGDIYKFGSLSSGCNNRASFRLEDVLSNDYTIDNAYCTHFDYNTTVYRDTTKDELGFIITGTMCYFRFTSSSNINTMTLANEWLVEQYNNGTPVKLVYILATPDPQPIELPNIPTHKGTTILEVDTTIQPSNAEVKYMGKP